MSGDNKPRTVKLLCPSLSKIISFAAWDEQKLDLASIAKAFGLDPSTLKLNGHFISRGVDFVSSSVTWRSLLNFFSTKGLSTGTHDHDALIVDGKLSKSRPKRGYEPEPEDRSRKSAVENKKLSSGYGDVDQVSLKRKQVLKDFCLLKRLKISETDSEIGDRGDKFQSTVSSGKVRCSHTIGPMKRMREDEMIIAAPCKKIR
ncbi:uncharacterized protein [Euphorbia lathyris]|uniref:uncharacterized protein isoform X2 n=1 Tax=Euphorbia lathyris TaxID=212925 RepID=UPI003313FF5E